MVGQRLAMAALGALAGVAAYGLGRLAEAQVLPDRLVLAITVFAAVFFLGVLVMTGPLRPLRAALGAGALGLSVAALALLASLRFAEVEGVMQPHLVLPALALATVPLPFWIAASRGAWRDYALLFSEAWSIVVRWLVAWAFAGFVWAVIMLSHGLLDTIGITVIRDLIEVEVVPYLITGAVLGLGLAVVQELQDYVSPYLILRLLRLVLPAVLGVTAVFLIALPLRGVTGVFENFGVAHVMLAMAGVAATLVTTAVDQDDELATRSGVLIHSARAMALLLPLLAGVAVWAIWLRVGQYGWTPGRIFAAEVAALGLGYGLLYALAVLRGAGWMARIRGANVTMALALAALAALSLTPALNHERISANGHLARYQSGAIEAAAVDPNALEQWGQPGAEVLATLTDIAAQPAQEALAERLANRALLVDAPSEALLAEVRDALPLQPATATAIRDEALSLLDAPSLRYAQRACAGTLPGGGPGCVMVVADFLPREPGEEALMVLWDVDGYARFEGFAQGRGRFVIQVHRPAGLPTGAEAAQLIRDWQAAPPAIEPAPINRTTGAGVFLLE